jgi:hypothetical protein
MSDPTYAQEEKQMSTALEGQIEEHLRQRHDPWHEQQEPPAMACDWCHKAGEVRWTLGVFLCEFCRIHWLLTGHTRSSE